MDNTHHNKIENKNSTDKEVISPEIFYEIKKEIWEVDNSKEWIQKIYEWKEKTFKKDHKFPKNIWKIDVNYLLSSTRNPKPINGCHQNVFILKAVLEKYGFQVNVMEVIPADWIISFNKKNKIPFQINSHALIKVIIGDSEYIIETTSQEFRILNQDKETWIIDNRRYPVLEWKSFNEIGITSKFNLYKAIFSANILRLLKP